MPLLVLLHLFVILYGDVNVTECEVGRKLSWLRHWVGDPGERGTNHVTAITFNCAAIHFPSGFYAHVPLFVFLYLFVIIYGNVKVTEGGVGTELSWLRHWRQGYESR